MHMQKTLLFLRHLKNMNDAAESIKKITEKNKKGAYNEICTIRPLLSTKIAPNNVVHTLCGAGLVQT